MDTERSNIQHPTRRNVLVGGGCGLAAGKLWALQEGEELVAFSGYAPGYRVDVQPKNPRLYEMAKAYVGGRADLLNKPMIWVAVEPEKGNGSSHPKVVGVLGISFIPDVVMHSDSPEATLRLFRRAQERAVDSGLQGEFLVYVEPERAELWKPLLERLKAEPAKRWAFQVAGIEV